VLKKSHYGFFCTLVTIWLTASAGSAMAADVVVSTLEWPPYTSANLPKGGASTEVVRQAFAAADVDMGVEILPWKRAISAAREDQKIVAYYPGYHCRHVDGFVASNPIGSGPLGFAENIEAPVTWASIDDIGEQRLKVGTVLGYANTDEFDEKAGTGWIRAIPARDDITNLRKLLLQRIDMAVIDKLVLSYLLATESSLQNQSDQLQFNAVPLEEKTLYLCFNDDADGLAMRDRFNEGLAKVDVEKIIEQYFAEEF
jgi:polar amino acid transport system substrate-binding protein